MPSASPRGSAAEGAGAFVVGMVMGLDTAAYIPCGVKGAVDGDAVKADGFRFKRGAGAAGQWPGHASDAVLAGGMAEGDSRRGGWAGARLAAYAVSG